MLKFLSVAGWRPSSSRFGSSRFQVSVFRFSSLRVGVFPIHGLAGDVRFFEWGVWVVEAVALKCDGNSTRGFLVEVPELMTINVHSILVEKIFKEQKSINDPSSGADVARRGGCACCEEEETRASV